MLMSLLLFSHLVFSQAARVDFAKFTAAPEKSELQEACKTHIQTMFSVLPLLSVDRLYIKNEYAFLEGKVNNGVGQEIDFTLYNAGKQGRFLPFKGQEAKALLKKAAGGWKVLALVVTPDDLDCVCWWAEYNAPKDLFKYTDYCR